MSDGRIELITGCMFSGKTTELLRRMNKYTHAKRLIYTIKYPRDLRIKGTEKRVATHTKMLLKPSTAPAVEVADVGKLTSTEIERIREAHVICIDEGQFIEGLSEFCVKWSGCGKVVIIAALNGTFEQKPWPRINTLYPNIDKITLLKAVCTSCFKDASFSVRKTKEKEIEVIGGIEKYAALCRTCLMHHRTGKLKL